MVVTNSPSKSKPCLKPSSAPTSRLGVTAPLPPARTLTTFCELLWARKHHLPVRPHDSPATFHGVSASFRMRRSVCGLHVAPVPQIQAAQLGQQQRLDPWPALVLIGREMLPRSRYRPTVREAAKAFTLRQNQLDQTVTPPSHLVRTTRHPVHTSLIDRLPATISFVHRPIPTYSLGSYDHMALSMPAEVFLPRNRLAPVHTPPSRCDHPLKAHSIEAHDASLR